MTVTNSAQAPRRLAAVVIPIFANPPHEVVFVERASHLRRHAGQIGFPGGAADEQDGGDLARTALRELDEEIGVPAAAVEIVARLAGLRQGRNVFDVTPFVAVVAPGTPLVIDLNEVSAAHRVPLAAILAPGAVRRATETVRDTQIVTTVFDFGALHVWGLTGSILDRFARRFHAGDSPLRSALEARLLAD